MLKPVTVPATLVRSKTGGVAAFVVLVVKGKQLYFEIDTGASNTVLDTSIAAELGLTAAGPTVTRGTLGCTATSQPMQVSDWSVGGEALPPGILITTKTQFAGKKLNGLPFAGLLGADLDAAFGELTVDYTGKTVTLGGQVSPTGKAVPVQILRNRGEVQVRTSAMMHAVSTAMVIDTGASTSEVDTALAKRARPGERRRASNGRFGVLLDEGTTSHPRPHGGRLGGHADRSRDQLHHSLHIIINRGVLRPDRQRHPVQLWSDRDRLHRRETCPRKLTTSTPDSTAQ